MSVIQTNNGVQYQISNCLFRFSNDQKSSYSFLVIDQHAKLGPASKLAEQIAERVFLRKYPNLKIGSFGNDGQALIGMEEDPEIFKNSLTIRWSIIHKEQPPIFCQLAVEVIHPCVVADWEKLDSTITDQFEKAKAGGFIGNELVESWKKGDGQILKEKLGMNIHK